MGGWAEDRSERRRKERERRIHSFFLTEALSLLEETLKPRNAE